MKISNVSQILCVGLLAGTGGCDDAAPKSEESTIIIKNLLEAGFPSDEIELRDDGEVWVGGDAVVGLDASYEMAEIWHDGGEHSSELMFRQYRTNNLISAAVDTICVDGSGITGTFSVALDGALANYNALDLSFRMVRTTGGLSGCDAEIDVNVVGAGTGASAGFPSGGLPFDTVTLGGGITGFGVDVTRHVVTHELGHCIGFRHTDYFNRSISCGGSPSNEGPAGVGAVHISNTPTGAVFDGSIMNACYNAGSSGIWDDDDIAGLHELYIGGTADIVWQNDNGQVHYWPMVNGVRQGGVNIYSPVGSSWDLEGVGDVDGDGTDDIIWQNDNGQVHYWPMKNGVRQGGINIYSPVGSGWDLAGVGDVDGDGTDDIVWRNTNGQVHYWPMLNGVRQGGINVFSPVGAEWQLKALGDVDGDGTDDVIWQHDNGQVHYWPMLNGVRQGGVNIFVPVGTAWELEGAGDVDSDGTDDIVWRNSSGQVHYWPMQGGVRQGGINIYSPVASSWRLLGVGDVDR